MVGDFHGAAGAGVGAGVVVVVVDVVAGAAVCAQAPPACSAIALTDASPIARIARTFAKVGRQEFVLFILLKDLSITMHASADVDIEPPVTSGSANLLPNLLATPSDREFLARPTSAAPHNHRLSYRARWVV
jgi:hypothetical protein